MIELNKKVTSEMNKYMDGITIEVLLGLLAKEKRTFHYPMILTEEQMKEDIAVLDLSVRAYHCMKRAGISTVGNLVEGFGTKDNETSKKQLRRIRNLGANTADDILMKLFYYQFHTLHESMRKSYMDEVLEANLFFVQ